MLLNDMDQDDFSKRVARAIAQINAERDNEQCDRVKASLQRVLQKRRQLGTKFTELKSTTGIENI